MVTVFVDNVLTRDNSGRLRLGRDKESLLQISEQPHPMVGSKGAESVVGKSPLEELGQYANCPTQDEVLSDTNLGTLRAFLAQRSC